MDQSGKSSRGPADQSEPGKRGNLIKEETEKESSKKRGKRGETPTTAGDRAGEERNWEEEEEDEGETL